MTNFFKNTNFFSIITKAILIIFPFYVFLSLSLQTLTWIKFIWFFLKEFLLILAFFALVWEFIKNKKLPKIDLLDYLIIAFFLYGIIITFVNWLWLKSIFYWWRYDFIFLVAFVIYKHWSQFLVWKVEDYVKLFVLSGTVSLFIWIFFKFRLKEEFLILFWYTDYVWNWVYSGWVPNYHWLEGSGMRRFQWILEWPNIMWFFLIVFSWFFVYLQKNKKEFYVFLFLLIMWILLFLTFSRSAILWAISAFWIIFLVNLKYFFQKYKKAFVSVMCAWMIIIACSAYIFSEQLKNIVMRESSTEWHFSRMIVWIKRFKEKPLWAWLAESWPAFRNIYPEAQTLEWEQHYIPESWFIQLLVEWWIIYLGLFLAILWIILSKLYKVSIVVFATFSAVLVMNLFLHIFEATYLSILLFILIWQIIYKD